MAPTRKTKERRQRRGTPELEPSEATAAELVEVPAAPRGLLAGTVEEWGEFWRSPLAAAVRPTDRPAIRRLFQMRDQQERLRRTSGELRAKAAKEPIVKGSTGQQVANPLFRAADGAAIEALALEPRIVALEDRFGLTPRARLNLGVVEQQGLSLKAQNDAFTAKLNEVTGGSDPRS